VVGADTVRSDRMASAMALTLVSERSKIVYRGRTTVLGMARCVRDMTTSAQSPMFKNAEVLKDAGRR
jgi:hypothetical protein